MLGGDGLVMIQAISLSCGNPGALACASELIGQDNLATIRILVTAELVGSLLYLLWNDCLGRDTARLVRAAKGLSYDRLREIKAMLESPPLGIDEARLALGVSEVKL